MRNNKTDLTIERIFNAPVDVVWRAWTEPKYLMKWSGPTGFTCPYSEVNLVTGGKYLTCMQSPEGKDYWSTGIYKEIEHQKRIVCSDSFSDKDGNVVPASYYGAMDDYPLVMEIVVTFEEMENATKLKLVHSGLPTGDNLEATISSWNQSLDKLEAVISGA